MMLASPLDGIGILDAAIVAVLGYAVVFFGLILLMIVIRIMGKFFIAKDKKREALNAAAKAAGYIQSYFFQPISNQLIQPFHAKYLVTYQIPYHRQSQPSCTQDRFSINILKSLRVSQFRE